VHTTSFPPILEQLGISLLVSTYQAGKLIVVRADGPTLNTHFRAMDKPMGMSLDSGRLAIGTTMQVWEFRNVPAVARKLEPAGKHDACYLPSRSHVTGDIDIHEMAWAGDELWFVNTRFSCLCTRSNTHSFVPRWRPPFITALAAEDRCHLNGLALVPGERGTWAPWYYATAVSATDVVDGWRDRRRDGGVILEVPTSKQVAGGLSMPHSPRLHNGELWVLNSGTGFLGKVDRKTGRFEPVTFCAGYLRGLAFVGNYAIVGLSRPRHDKTFGGLALDEELVRRGAEARCGLQVIDLRNGDVVHWVRLEGMVSELYDVVVLPGVARPMAFGFRSDEIQRTVAIGAPEQL
jgi:uncharacterized protein (TIGR03032 family)